MRFSTIILAAASASVAFAGDFWAKCTFVPKELHSDKGFVSKFVIPLPGTSIQVYYPALRAGGSHPIDVYTRDGMGHGDPFGYRVHIKQQLGNGDWYFWKVNGGDEISMMDNMASEFVLEGDNNQFVIKTADGGLSVQVAGSDGSLKLGAASSALQLRALDEPSCASGGYEAE
ncbi:unnamed protein product [Mortierella alpina]